MRNRYALPPASAAARDAEPLRATRQTPRQSCGSGCSCSSAATPWAAGTHPPKVSDVGHPCYASVGVLVVVGCRRGWNTRSGYPYLVHGDLLRLWLWAVPPGCLTTRGALLVISGQYILVAGYVQKRPEKR